MVSPSSSRPYLSVVAASRNDDHGGDPLIRTQIFLNTFARQCEHYRLPAELILVDWNPVAGRPGLANVLQLPAEATYCSARVITVPAVLHDRLKYADRLPFFQMIAKNAGIRRARGQFILATNIDIIFSDELMRHISRQQLDPTKMLRVDRYDIQQDIPPTFSVEQTLDYAWSHPVRSHRRLAPLALVEQLYGADWFKRTVVPDPKASPPMTGITVGREGEFWAVRSDRDRPIDNLHANACGDFTLLAREGWEAISGYPEFHAFSMNIDSVGLAAAHYAGFEEVALLPPCVCFHIEHSLGSGWTPEGEEKLFTRLQQGNIPNPDWDVISYLTEAMRLRESPVAMNGPAWGLAGFELPDEPLLPGRIVPGPAHPRSYRAPSDLPVSALLPEFDLDVISLTHARHTVRLRKLFKDSQTALKQAEGYLRLVDKDSADRLAALEQYGVKMKECDARMKQMDAYTLSIEKDRAERLASINHYQEKLKKAYEDHAHNVAYIERLHTEIALHVKIAAERDAIIAQLNEQLRVATERRPAGP
ncbi:MAG: hypothetical protein PSU94_01090 [Lacunisphaera sp.]|nr:hypothetical protein [Lacunisphaera sp.]